MLCVKCGEEYEGASCPRCEGPQILVNNDDYLRRKRAYEEKQAAKGSASSGNMDAAKGEESKGSKKPQKKKVEFPTVDWRGLVKRCARPLVLLLAGIAVIAVIVTAFLGGKQTAYVRFEGNVYALKGEKVELICSDDKAFFTADGKSFYENAISEEYADRYVIEKQASPDGKCFVAALYDEVSDKFSIALIKDNKTYIVTESDMRLDVMYVSDEGSVVYTSLDIVNDEGYSGGYELFVYEADNKKKPLEGGKVKQLTDELSYADVLTGAKVVLFADKDNNLRAYNYGAEGDVEYIAENVASVYMPDNDAAGKYVSHTGYVCMDEKSTGIIYKEGSKCYYLDFKEKTDERTYIGSVAGGVATIIYKKNEYMYYVDGDKLCITVANKMLNESGNGYSTVLETKELALLSSLSDVMWIADSSSLVYVNANNELCKAQKDVIITISTNVLADTVDLVDGTKQGIIYAQSDGWRYMSDLQANAVKIDVLQDLYVKKVVSYNGKLHLVLSDNKLYSCKVKGGELKEINLAEYVWLTNK